MKQEFKYSDDTRFDFLCDKNLLEVKNVTLLRNKDFAEFPDAITSRGSKHLIKLAESIKKGYKPFVLFLTQIEEKKTRTEKKGKTRLNSKINHSFALRIACFVSSLLIRFFFFYVDLWEDMGPLESQISLLFF